MRDSEMPAGKLFTTRQPKPLGLGHAIWCAKSLIGDEPFAVLLPDVLTKGDAGCMTQMVKAYNQKGGNIISLQDVPKERVVRYGVIDPGEDDGTTIEIKGMVEKPKAEDAPSTLTVVGRYILQPEVFTHLDQFERGAGDEIQLTDAIVSLLGKQPIHGIRYDGKSYDCGSRLGFIEANIAYGLDDPSISSDVKDILKKF